MFVSIHADTRRSLLAGAIVGFHTPRQRLLSKRPGKPLEIRGDGKPNDGVRGLVEDIQSKTSKGQRRKAGRRIIGIRAIVEITGISTDLDYSVDLKTLTPVGLPGGNVEDLSLNWENITVNARGGPFTPSSISEIVVAKFTDMSVCDLETEFLDLEVLADERYTAELGTVNTGVDLSNLTRVNDGAPFNGIDDAGLWIAALLCRECSNSAPWFMTILQPCD
jgi:hypothetical protein